MNSPKRAKHHWWKPAACLRVSGEDSATFLQGQFTNDLQQPGVSGAVYGLWLNQKGKVLADSFITRIAEKDFRIVSYFSPVSVILPRLEAYVIADDVVIEDLTGDSAGVAVFGEAKTIEGGWSFAGRRSGVACTEIIFPQHLSAEIRAKMDSSTELSSDAMERMRIDAAIPAVPADIGPSDLPNEGGLETDAISYTKGCYLGQEVMARLKSMGRVRRRLTRASGAGNFPALPAALFQKGKKVGELRSAVNVEVGWVGLAMISSLQISTGEGLAFAADDGASIKIEERT